MIGKTLAHYEILEPLGSGGMGDVYRARDRKLERDVAIKLLPEHFTEDENRLARFAREAKLLAALNHPNIAAIYGFEEVDGAHFLVLELVGGGSLDVRIASGQLPIEKALGIARQVARALEAAHEAGIVHRDLKPANVLFAVDGRVKVLDFGIAKSMRLPETAATTRQATDLTVTGTIVGTPAYMSPEQLRGASVDARVDNWAFGCLLYEILTGTSAFGRETTADTLVAIIEAEPDWDRLPPGTAAPIESLLHECLRKDREERLRSIGAARSRIDNVLSGSAVRTAPLAAASAAPEEPARSNRRILVAATLLILGFAAFTGIWLSGGFASDGQPPASTRANRWRIELRPDEWLDRGGAGTYVAMAADGSRIAYLAKRGVTGLPRMYVRELPEIDAREIPGTENADSPFFSPDGEHVGFFVGRQLKTVSIRGGLPTDFLAVDSQQRGASWGPDGSILVATENGGIQRVVPADRAATVVATPGSADMSYRWPYVLPDGDSILFTIWTGNFDTAELAVVSTAGGTVRELGIQGSHPTLLESGHLLFARPGSLWVTNFDTGQMEARGTPMLIEQDVYVFTGGSANYGVSNDGTLVYVPRDEASRSSIIAAFDREGEEVARWSDDPGELYFPRLSPDGRRFAVVVRAESSSDVWIRDLETNAYSPLTDEGTNWGPLVWSPDGRWIAYLRETAGQGWDVHRIRTDFGGDPEVIAEGPGHQRALRFDEDGTFVFASVADVYERPASGVDVRQWEAPNPPGPSYRTSPDGRWIAFVREDTGRKQVWVRPVGRAGEPRQVSMGGGTTPLWSPDGTELFFVAGPTPDEAARGFTGAKLMAAPVVTDPELRAEEPRELFATPFQTRLDVNSPFYDYSVAEQRFFVVMLANPDARLGQINVVQPWYAGLPAGISAQRSGGPPRP